ncbi:MAG: type II secretion system protein N [Burkholderiaceae bacterium]
MTIVRLRPAKGRARPAAAAPVEGQVRALRLQRKLAWAGAALGLVLGAIAFLPASLVAHAVGSATNDQFMLAEAEGTVWNGSALAVLTGGRGADGQDSRDASVLPSRLSWRLRPRWNGLALHLSQDCCLPRGVDLSVRRAFGAWQVAIVGPGEDADAPPEPVTQGGSVAGGAGSPDAVAMARATPIGQWPLAWLEGRGFPWSTIHPGGLLTLTTHRLSFSYRDGHWHSHGSAQLDVNKFSSSLSTLGTLGTYRVLIQADPVSEPRPGEGATRSVVWISTLDGALLIDGRGLAGPQGVRLRAEAHAAAGSESALDNLLNLIGRRNGALSVISIG